jgi:hypothetical protein
MEKHAASHVKSTAANKPAAAATRERWGGCVAGGDAPFRPEVGQGFVSRGGIPAGLPSLTVGSPQVSLRCSTTLGCVAGGDAPFRPEVGQASGGHGWPRGRKEAAGRCVCCSHRPAAQWSWTFRVISAHTSSLRAPISVRSRSASRAASKGFLKTSLTWARSIVICEPSSGSRAMTMVSAYSALRRRF